MITIKVNEVLCHIFPGVRTCSVFSVVLSLRDVILHSLGLYCRKEDLSVRLSAMVCVTASAYVFVGSSGLFVKQ